MIQEGNIGLLESLNNFDPKESKFSSYAYRHIKRNIIQYLRTKNTLIAIPEKKSYMFFYIQKKLNIEINDDYSEIFDKIESNINITKEKTKELIQVSKIMNVLYTDDFNINSSNIASDIKYSTENEAIEKIYNDNLKKVLKKVLTLREFNMITIYFGLSNKTNLNYSQIAKKENISTQRVCEIINNIYKKLSRNQEIKALKESL